MNASNTTPVRIWDLPTRLFHWSLVACIVGSLISINIAGNAVAWHFRFGYAILALLLFRLVWGFVGPVHARFSSFPPAPGSALAYLRGQYPHRGGHSPLGALSVYALLLSIAVQVSTGLFANDAIMWEGPLYKHVSGATSNTLTSIHHTNRIVLIGLIVLHVCAIAWYRFARGERIVQPMLRGDRFYPAEQAPSIRSAEDGAGLRVKGLVVFALCAAAVWGLLEWAR